MKNTVIKINNDSIQISNMIFRTLINHILFINQIFSNHLHETHTDKQDITQWHTMNCQSVQLQNPVSTQNYQPTQMHNEISLPYYLQQHEITKSQLTKVSQIPNAAESLQMTMNPYFMGGSSLSSNKPLIVFTGTDFENSVEEYLIAVTDNLNLNIGSEPINTTLHQNWIHRRTAPIQTTLDGAAKKWFSVSPIDI